MVAVRTELGKLPSSAACLLENVLWLAGSASHFLMPSEEGRVRSDGGAREIQARRGDLTEEMISLLGISAWDLRRWRGRKETKGCVLFVALPERGWVYRRSAEQSNASSAG